MSGGIGAGGVKVIAAVEVEVGEGADEGEAGLEGTEEIGQVGRGRAGELEVAADDEPTDVVGAGLVEDLLRRVWVVRGRGPAGPRGGAGRGGAGRHGRASGGRRGEAAAPRWRGPAVRAVIVNLVDEPTVGGFVVTAHDISARIAMEVELRTALSLLKATLESTADGVLVVDQAGTITGVNGRLGEMFQAPEGFLDHKVDRPMDDKSIAFVLEQLVNPEAFLSVNELFSAHPEHETTDILEFKDGRVFERFSRPQLVDGEIVGRVWSFRDSTERVRLESELSYQAFHDSLTGLANKALFTDRLNLAVARMERTRKPIAVMFLDLDNFKTVNDSLGHSVGDQLLGGVAEVLLGCIRSTDTAARLGGDEFAVLIDYLEAHSDIVALAERILTALRRPLTLGTTEVVATASIGITFGVPGTTGEQLLRNADLAMYRAKEHGKDRFEEFRDHMHTAIVERLELEADLRRTMGGAQELVVHYQPVVDLTTGAIIGFEALVRWQHPLRGLLAPGSFIPFAEEVGLIDVVDRFVLAERAPSCTTGGSADSWPPTRKISVNLSARESRIREPRPMWPRCWPARTSTRPI